MQGWGGGGINFGRGLRSMGSRFARSSWEVDAPGTSSNSGLFSNKYPNHEIGNPLQVLTPSQVANQSFSRRLNYVVLEDGTLIMGRQKRDVIGGGHIDLASGKDVLAAGEVKFVDGKIRYIDNSSGHYLPSGKVARDAALNAFQDAGLGGRGLYVEKYWDANRRAWVPK
jgi:filamentous hemagglutinin